VTMADQFFTALSTLAGGAIAITGALLTNRSNTARLKIQLDHDAALRTSEVFRDRGEELYVLMEKWLKILASEYVKLSSVMQGKITYAEFQDLYLEDAEQNKIEFPRIELLVDIYYSSTRKAYDEIMASRAKLQKISSAHKRAYERRETNGRQFLEPYIEAQRAVEAAGEVFKAEITKAIRGV